MKYVCFLNDDVVLGFTTDVEVAVGDTVMDRDDRSDEVEYRVERRIFRVRDGQNVEEVWLMVRKTSTSYDLGKAM